MTYPKNCCRCKKEFTQENRCSDRYYCTYCRAEKREEIRLEEKRQKNVRNTLKENVEQFKQQNNIQVKCISDQIMLYYRYSISKLDIRPEDRLKLLERCDKIYYERIRGDMEFTNKLPKSIAAGLVYVSCVMDGVNRTQKDVAATLSMSEASIRTNYKIFKNKGCLDFLW